MVLVLPDTRVFHVVASVLDRIVPASPTATYTVPNVTEFRVLAVPEVRAVQVVPSVLDPNPPPAVQYR